MKTFFLLIVLLLVGCNSPEIYQFQGKIMGTYYVVKVQKFDEQIDREKLGREIQGLLESLNLTFSTYDEKSELSFINKAKANTPVMLSSDLKIVLSISENVYNSTGGAFNITVGPLVNLWGFGPDKLQRQPRQHEIDAKKKMIGMDKFKVSASGLLVKNIDDLYIDLSAVAKGYAVDRVLQFLRDKAYKAAMVEIGGEINAYGNKADGTPWMIGIEEPNEKLGEGINRIVPLVDKAIATSGSYRNFHKYGEQVFSHTIDPQTGKPITHQLISVSVIADTCAFADAIATGLMVLGPTKGFDYVERENIMAYFLYLEEGKLVGKSSSQMQKYLEYNKLKEEK